MMYFNIIICINDTSTLNTNCNLFIFPVNKSGVNLPSMHRPLHLHSPGDTMLPLYTSRAGPVL